MTESPRHEVSARRTTELRGDPSRSARSLDRQLSRWGGRAALAGVILMIGAIAVVVALGLPDASDVETLRDFSDIETGRILEHFFYLGALMLFALHVLVLYRLLATAHSAAALFGTAVAEFGFVILAAGSLLHVATSPLADLYTAPGTTAEERQSIEYAWQGAQSVFDTLLATGVLLVPIGIVLLGVAMRRAPAFGPRLAWLSIGLGALGVIGAVIEAVDPELELSAASVLAIVMFELSTGWRTLRLGDREAVDLSGSGSARVD